MSGEPATPTLTQRVRYIAGATLLPAMHRWVIDDLTGPGAARRYHLRILLPIIAPLCVFLLIPGPLWMGLAMMALLYLPLIYFTTALMYVYRRHRPRQARTRPGTGRCARAPETRRGTRCLRTTPRALKRCRRLLARSRSGLAVGSGPSGG